VSSRCGEACKELEYRFGETGTEHLLTVPVPMAALGACKGDTVELK